MKRTLPWAVVALAPLVLLLLTVTFDSAVTQFFASHASHSAGAAFLAKYWWSFVFGVVALHFIWFILAALRNRSLSLTARLLWSVAFVALGPVVAPAYWWVASRGA